MIKKIKLDNAEESDFTEKLSSAKEFFQSKNKNKLNIRLIKYW